MSSENIDLQVTRAAAADATECVRVRGMTRENAVSEERLRAHGITAESWAEDIRTGRLPGWVARRGGQIVGYCFGATQTGEVVVLALLPQEEGRGLGKRLLQLVIDELRSQGHGRLFLGCAADSAVRSHGFYRHLGWESTGTTDQHGDEVLELHLTTVRRSVRIGGKGRIELLAELQKNGIGLNPAGMELFANEKFICSEATAVLQTTDFTVHGLGFPQGATIDKIFERAAQLGMFLCPLELGPHLRLQYRDQPEGCLGYPPSTGRAPLGSLTVASQSIDEDDDDIPKGFYLRRINGVLWLRGYRSDSEHIWSPEDRFVFVDPHTAA